MNDTTIDVATIPTIDRAEALELAETEYHRFLDMLRLLQPDDWAKPTDCDAWDVEAMVQHVLGAMDANASVREMVHQFRRGAKVAKERGLSMALHGANEVQIEERSDVHGDALVARFAATIDKAVRGRRRFRGPLRALKVPVPGGSKRSLGWLNDIVYTRDTWLHRVDIARATGRPLELTAAHDGRIVADVVAEWARQHGAPFELVLTGPAGGRYRGGSEGEHGEQQMERHELDAVELCRMTSGRADGAGLLATEVVF
jgi:uncharacterized protein (TIGR03083 family)